MSEQGGLFDCVGCDKPENQHVPDGGGHRTCGPGADEVFAPKGVPVAGELRADLRHKMCGQVSVYERPHAHRPELTELYCAIYRWIILDLHVDKACDSVR